MSDTTVAVAESASPSARLVDNEALVVAAKNVVRQRVRLAGASAADLSELAASAPSSGAMGLVVRGVDASTETTLASALAQLVAILAKLNSTLDVSDRSGRLLGHVTVDSAPTTAVTGPLTDTQLRAGAVPVSGSITTSGTADVTDRSSRLLGHVAVDSSALPAGAATSALQGAGLPVALTAGGGVKVGIVDALPAGTAAIGHVTVDAAPAVTGTVAVSNMIAAVETGLAKAAQFPSTIGQHTMAASTSVAIASDQVAVPVSGTVTATGPLTDTQLRASAVPISAASLPLPSGAATEATVAKRFGGAKTTGATTVSTNGANTIYTPASGKTLTLLWIFLSSSQNNAAEVLATVKLGAKVVYQAYMGNPGAFGHWESIVADNPNDALIVTLSAGGQSVAVSYTTTEA